MILAADTTPNLWTTWIPIVINALMLAIAGIMAYLAVSKAKSAATHAKDRADDAKEEADRANKIAEDANAQIAALVEATKEHASHAAEHAAAAREANDISRQHARTSRAHAEMQSKASLEIRDPPGLCHIRGPEIQSITKHWRTLPCGVLWNSGKMPIRIQKPTSIEGLDSNGNKTNSMSKCKARYRIREYGSSRGWETVDLVPTPVGLAPTYELRINVDVLFETEAEFSRVRVVIPWTYDSPDGTIEANHIAHVKVKVS